MKDAITNIAIAGAATAAILAFIVLLLSDNQQTQLLSLFVLWWNWIDEKRRRPVLVLVRFDRGRPQRILAIIAHVLAVIGP